MKVPLVPRIFPNAVPAFKLFTTGATVGPLVDSLHNQCLLKYDRAPIDIVAPWNKVIGSGIATTTDYDTVSYILRTSWYIPPLLGVAYLVLGAILPRCMSLLLQAIQASSSTKENPTDTTTKISPYTNKTLQTKAILAVTSTALIIKLSEFLETTPSFSESIQQQLTYLNLLPTGEINLFIMIAAVLTQWVILDGTLSALLVAIIVSIGGPLSELPFVASGFWEYIPSASDYFPLQGWNLAFLSDYQDLALSSITGPCYFAVAMDAIALGRWFDTMDDQID